MRLTLDDMVHELPFYPRAPNNLEVKHKALQWCKRCALAGNKLPPLLGLARLDRLSCEASHCHRRKFNIVSAKKSMSANLD